MCALLRLAQADFHPDRAPVKVSGGSHIAKSKGHLSVLVFLNLSASLDLRDHLPLEPLSYGFPLTSLNIPSPNTWLSDF